MMFLQIGQEISTIQANVAVAFCHLVPQFLFMQVADFFSSWEGLTSVGGAPALDKINPRLSPWQ